MTVDESGPEIRLPEERPGTVQSPSTRIEGLPAEPDETGSRPDRPAPGHAGRSARELLREMVETGVLALLVFLCIRGSFQNFVVDGRSMYPTLDSGQFLVVNRLVYAEIDVEKLSRFVPFVSAGNAPKRNLFHGPERGDIVIFRDPGKPEIDLVKRVIGLPGETVEIVNGRVYINDRLLLEPYIKREWHGSKPKIAIPAGQYFVMGDNRDASQDSRSAEVGLVPRELIIGKAMLRYWPPGKFGLAPNEAGDISTKDGRPQVTDEILPGASEAMDAHDHPRYASEP